jgi:hypothetical protein
MKDESSAVNNFSLAPEAKIKVPSRGLCGCGNGGCWIVCENPFREMDSFALSRRNFFTH